MRTLFRQRVETALISPGFLWPVAAAFACIAGVFIFSLPVNDLLLIGTLGIDYTIFSRTFFIAYLSLISAVILSAFSSAVDSSPFSFFRIVRFSRAGTTAVLILELSAAALRSLLLVSLSAGPLITAAALSGITPAVLTGFLLLIFLTLILLQLIIQLVKTVPESLHGGILVTIWLAGALYSYFVHPVSGMFGLQLLLKIHAAVLAAAAAGLLLRVHSYRRRQRYVLQR